MIIKKEALFASAIHSKYKKNIFVWITSFYNIPCYLYTTWSIPLLFYLGFLFTSIYFWRNYLLWSEIFTTLKTRKYFAFSIKEKNLAINTRNFELFMLTKIVFFELKECNSMYDNSLQKTTKLSNLALNSYTFGLFGRRVINWKTGIKDNKIVPADKGR